MSCLWILRRLRPGSGPHSRRFHVGVGCRQQPQNPAPGSTAAVAALNEATAKAGGKESLRLLMDQIRKGDRDQFLAINLAPRALRPIQFVLRSLNLELAQVKDTTCSNPQLGSIRVQWWRDNIHKAYAFAHKHRESTAAQFEKEMVELLPPQPAIRVLSQVVRVFPDLPLVSFDSMLEARENDLFVTMPQDIEALMSYCDSTASSLLYIALHCAGAVDEGTLQVAAQLGRALALTTLLRFTPVHFSTGHTYIPIQLFEKHNVNPDPYFAKSEGEPSEELRAALRLPVYDIACLAQSHLDQARDMRAQVSSKALPILRAAESSSSFLRNLERHQFDVFHPDVQSPPGSYIVQLYLRYLAAIVRRKY